MWLACECGGVQHLPRELCEGKWRSLLSFPSGNRSLHGFAEVRIGLDDGNINLSPILASL